MAVGRRWPVSTGTRRFDGSEVWVGIRQLFHTRNDPSSLESARDGLECVALVDQGTDLLGPFACAGRPACASAEPRHRLLALG